MRKTYLKQSLFNVFCKIYRITDGPIWSQIAQVERGFSRKPIRQCATLRLGKNGKFMIPKIYIGVFLVWDILEFLFLQANTVDQNQWLWLFVLNNIVKIWKIFDENC